MGIIFISHSSQNNAEALEIRDWLREHGWRHTFLDLDPEDGLTPGQRWQEELKRASERCAAVMVLISPAWLASKWCQVELLLAAQLGKRIFGVVIAPTPLAEIPIELAAHYQLVDISDPASKLEGLDSLRFGLKRAGLDPKDFPWPPLDEPERRAYRGLQAFEEQDAGIFFGRDAPITRGLDALRRMRAGSPERLMVVLGASGAGKSSFLRAGLLARLQRDEENFVVLPAIRPERDALSGPRGFLRAFGIPKPIPRKELSKRLAELRQPRVEQLRRYAEAVRETPAARQPTLVLPIDQAEELFTNDNVEGPDALDLMHAALDADDDLIMILTLRSDSFSRLQNEPKLAIWKRLLLDLPRLSYGAFKEVIEAPGRLAEPKIILRPELTERLLADLEGGDALPLLAFTLERLVAEYGKSGELELRHFLDGLGGLAGAIERAVEAAFQVALGDPLLPNKKAQLEQLARRAFLPWLVSLDTVGAAPNRRMARWTEIPHEARDLVRHLTNQRLLVSDEQQGEATVEISHEAVLRHWSALAQWIEEERDTLHVLHAARRAAEEWRRLTSDSSTHREDAWLLHRGERLLRAEELLERPDYRQLLGARGKDYLAACRGREERELEETARSALREQQHLRRQHRLQRRAALALLFVALTVAVFAVFVVKQSRDASHQASVVLTDYARRAVELGHFGRAARLSILAAREGPLSPTDPAAPTVLASAAHQSSLVMEFRAHSRGVRGLMLSPDQEHVLTWGEDGAVRLWAIDAGVEVAQVFHEGAAQGAMFDGLGNRVLSWSDAGTAQVWEATTGRLLIAMKNLHRARNPQLDARGERWLYWGYDNVLRVWNIEKATEVAALKHESTIDGALFDASGQRVLSWADGLVRVWDIASESVISTTKHDGGVGHALFDPAGGSVLSWSESWKEDGKVVRVWNPDTGSRGPETAFWKHPYGLEAVVFDLKGSRALSWDSRGNADLRLFPSGEVISPWDADQKIDGGTFDAEGRLLLSWNREGAIHVWQIETGEIFGEWGLEGGIAEALLSPSGQRVLSWNRRGVIRVWDVATGAEIGRSSQREALVGASFDASGERVMTWSADGAVRIFDFSSDHRVSASVLKPGVLDVVDGAMFTGAGKRVLSWSSSGVLRLWEAGTGLEVAESEHRRTGRGFIGGASIDASGERVLSWTTDGTFRVWNPITGSETTFSKHEDRIRGATFRPGKTEIISWSNDGWVRVWNSETGEDLSASRHERLIQDAVFDATGERVLSYSSRLAKVWNAETGDVMATIRHDSSISGASFDPRGDRVLTWGLEIAGLWDAATGQPIVVFGGDASGAILAPVGSRVLTWNYDGRVRVWDGATGSVIATTQHDRGIRGATFDGKGERVLSWSPEKRLIWSATTGEQLAELGRGHHLDLEKAKFDPAGELVLSWDWDDGTVRIWDSATGFELGDFVAKGPFDIFPGALFDPTGDRVLSWSSDGIARVWDVRWLKLRPSNQALIDEVCHRRLLGPETLLRVPFTNGSGQTITHDSARRISAADATFAPLLLQRVGEDVCARPTF